MEHGFNEPETPLNMIFNSLHFILGVDFGFVLTFILTGFSPSESCSPPHPKAPTDFQGHLLLWEAYTGAAGNGLCISSAVRSRWSSHLELYIVFQYKASRLPGSSSDELGSRQRVFSALPYRKHTQSHRYMHSGTPYSIQAEPNSS